MLLVVRHGAGKQTQFLTHKHVPHIVCVVQLAARIECVYFAARFSVSGVIIIADCRHLGGAYCFIVVLKCNRALIIIVSLY